MPRPPSGLITALRALLADRPMDLQRVATIAGVSLESLQRLLTPARLPRVITQTEGFLHAHGATLILVIDGHEQTIRLARPIPRVIPVTVPPTEAYPGKVLQGAVPVAGVIRELTATSLGEVLRGILRAHTNSDLSTWDVHRAAATAGLTPAMRLAVCRGLDIPVLTTLERLLTALGIAMIIRWDQVTWRLGRKNRLPSHLLVTVKRQLHRPGARLGARSPLAPSPLVRALVLIGRLHDRSGFAQAQACGLSADRLSRWRRTGVDQNLATLETAVVALGGRLVLTGERVIRVPPIRLPAGRVHLVIRDAASARRSSVARSTNLKGDLLEHELLNRVKRYRLKLLRELAQAESAPPAMSLTEWVCGRRDSLSDGGEPWSILALSLVTGLSRMAVQRLLERMIDERPVLRFLAQLGLTLSIEPAPERG